MSTDITDDEIARLEAWAMAETSGNLPPRASVPSVLVVKAVAALRAQGRALAASRAREEEMREALELIAGHEGMTLLGPDGERAHERGANAAFEQMASIAKSALEPRNAKS